MKVKELQRMLNMMPQDADVIVVLEYDRNYIFKPFKVLEVEKEEVQILADD